MSDISFGRVGWTLKFSDLTADEVQVLWSLFQSAEGRLYSFLFLDPSANLLCWSDDLTQSVWSKDPGLEFSAVQDAFGGTSGTQIANGAAAVQSVVQTTNAPATLQYCLSAYLRSDTPGTQATFEIGGGAKLTASVSGTWQRWQATAGGGAGEQATFGLSIPAGTTVEVCGLQTEAQPAAGVYKNTTAMGGVFPNSRFDQDTLGITATEAGLFACNLRIVSQL
jgi:hypothetical protein